MKIRLPCSLGCCSINRFRRSGLSAVQPELPNVSADSTYPPLRRCRQTTWRPSFPKLPQFTGSPRPWRNAVHALSQALLDEYRADASDLWTGVSTAAELRKRIEALPGFGTYKARILIGILGNNFGVRPKGWEDERANWPSVADVTKYEDVAALKERKAAWKATQK